MNTRNKVPLWTGYHITGEWRTVYTFLWGSWHFLSSETWDWMTNISFIVQCQYESIPIKHHFRKDAVKKKAQTQNGLKFRLSYFYDVKISFSVILEAYTPQRCLYEKLTVLFSFLLQVCFKHQDLLQKSGKPLTSVESVVTHLSE